MLQQSTYYALLMCVAGIGIPIMAALNGSLGNKVQSPVLATAILFTTGCVISLAYLFLSGGVPKLAFKEHIPFHYYFGGVLVLFYIVCMTWTAPKFGVGNAIAMVLLGQIIAIAVIDHYALFGALKHTISIQRLVGLILMIFGVYLTVRVDNI